MHVYKELRFEGNKPGLDSLAKNIYTVFPMNWIKPKRKKKRFTVMDDEILEKIKKNCVDTLSFRRSHSIFKITAYSL